MSATARPAPLHPELPPPEDPERPVSPPGNLPLPLTSFIGREREAAALRDLLHQQGIRLVTLTGPGGVGKTRLAIRVIHDALADFPGGIWFVPLATVRDPTLVASTIAQTLGVREVEGRRIEDSIAARLRERATLLVLDNFEQILNAGPFVADLLGACPQLKILVTSRAILRISGEHTVPVPPLALPSRGGEESRSREEANPLLASSPPRLLDSDAVRLFVERAAAAKTGFTLTPANAGTIAAICHRLDGLPLALELAAARIAAFSPDLLLSRLDERLPLLSDGPRDQPLRLQSMHDAIAWSYDLLSPADQTLLRHLSVFTGGCTLDAAEAVSRAGEEARSREENAPLLDASTSRLLDSVSSLVGKSLLAPQETVHGETRFTMLETIREFAVVQLAAHGERDAARQRHAAYFLALAERSEIVPYLVDGERIMGQLDAEFANVRAALAWFHSQRDAGGMLRLAGALGLWSSQRGHLREVRGWLEQAIPLGRETQAPALAKGLICLGIAAHLTGDERRALALVTEGHAIADPAADPYVVFLGLTVSGLITLRLNDLEQAAAFQEAALALIPLLGQHEWVELAASTVLGNLGNIAVARGDIDEAETHFTAALDRQRALGFAPGTSHVFASHPIAGLGDVARARGDHAAALTAYQDALRLAHRFRDTRATAYALGGVAGALSAAGNWTQAARLFGAAETLHETAAIHFDLETMDRQRALGLPEPWQRANDPFGAGQPLRDTLTRRSTRPIPPIPDPGSAAQLWAGGRTMPLSAAIAAATQVHVERHPGIAGLTTREHDVLRLLAAGNSNQQIGAALFISPRTAQTHVTHLLAKLGAANRTEAAAVAHRLGLG